MDVILNTQTEAQAVLDALSNCIRKNKDNIVTVGNLKTLTGQETTYEDHRLGWSSVRDAIITLEESYCTLTLPDPTPVSVIVTDRVMSILEGR